LVSVGTILTLGIVAAVGIAGYAIYSNLGKVGTVVTAGVTKSISDPFGNWLDSVIGGSKNGAGNGAGNGGIPSPLDVLPTATAQLPTGDVGIEQSVAKMLTSRYLPRAQKSAKTILKIFQPKDQPTLIARATVIGEKSATPALTQAQVIVDQARVSVGGRDSLTNKFYQLFTLANKPVYQDNKILPLSKGAVQFYATRGIIAREVYL